MNNYQIRMDIIVTDRVRLAAFAKTKARLCGVSEHEFIGLQSQAYDAENEVGFWLGWIFDSPLDCGFDIEDSETIFQS